MKWTKLMAAALFIGLLAANCQKEEVIPPDQEVTPRSETTMVPFKAKGGTIGLTYGTTNCYIDGDLFGIIPQFTYFGGNATHLGKIDEATSYTEFLTCNIATATGINTVEENILILNENGDGFLFSGEVLVNFQTKIGEGHFEVVEGFGKFEGASGWADMVANYDQQSENHGQFTGNGMVTQPNH